MPIIIKTTKQIEGIRKASKLAASILDKLGKSIYTGMKTKEIDELNMKLIKEAGATPAPLDYRGYPKSVCVSPNEVVCHGIPGENTLKDGDIVNIDVTVTLNGYFGDTSKTFFVGTPSKELKKFVETAEKAMYKGVKQVYPDNYLSNIGYAIQKYAERNGYSVVRDYCGHGTGLKFHEEPQVLHYGRKNRGIKLQAGMIFTIEPMINMGGYECELDKKDKWTARTKDGSLSAQFEHTILVTEDAYEILTIPE